MSRTLIDTNVSKNPLPIPGDFLPADIQATLLDFMPIQDRNEYAVIKIRALLETNDPEIQAQLRYHLFHIHGIDLSFASTSRELHEACHALLFYLQQFEEALKQTKSTSDEITLNLWNLRKPFWSSHLLATYQPTPLFNLPPLLPGREFTISDCASIKKFSTGESLCLKKTIQHEELFHFFALLATIFRSAKHLERFESLRRLLWMYSSFLLLAVNAIEMNFSFNTLSNIRKEDTDALLKSTTTYFFVFALFYGITVFSFCAANRSIKEISIHYTNVFFSTIQNTASFANTCRKRFLSGEKAPADHAKILSRIGFLPVESRINFTTDDAKTADARPCL